MDSSETPWTEILLSSLKKSDIAGVQRALAGGVSPNTLDENGVHLVIRAVNAVNLELLRLLIAAHANVNVTSSDGSTPLHLAIKSYNLEMVRTLIDAGADVNAKDKSGMTPAMLVVNGLASRWDNSLAESFILTLLSFKEAALDVVDSAGNTALLYAVKNNRLDNVRVLIGAGADANVKDKKGLVPAMLATQFTDGSVLQLLISRNPNLHAHDSNGHAALHHAIKHTQLENTKTLIDAGADVNVKDKDGMTPAMLAVRVGSLAMLELLVNAGADLTVQDNEGYTALHHAIREEKFDMVNRLVDVGFNVSTPTKDGVHPLIHAAKSRNNKLLCTTIASYPDVNVVSPDGDTPLHLAIKSNNLEMVKTLIDAGADVNAKDKDGNTPAMLAVSLSHYALLDALARAGAGLYDPGSSHQAQTCEVKYEEMLVVLESLFFADSGLRISDTYRPKVVSFKFVASSIDKQIAQFLAINRASRMNQNDNNSIWGRAPSRNILHNYLNSTRSTTLISKDGIMPLVLVVCNSKTDSRNVILTLGAPFNPAKLTISPFVPSDVIRAIVPEDTPFWLAANNDAPMLAAELAGGLDPNMKTENGMTLLHWACAGDAPECVQLLLDAGAGIEVGDPKPIFYCMHESSRCLESIISCGAKFNVTHNRCLPMHFALTANSLPCITALVGAGAWETNGDGKSISVLEAALTRTPISCDVVRTLLAAAGEKVLSQKIDDLPPLYSAIKNSNIDLVRILVEGGADVNESFKASDNALMYAQQQFGYSYSDPRSAAIFKYLVSRQK